MVEFVSAVPALLFLGLGSIQTGLIYHGKATLNYATFEAARAGAVNHAQVQTMKNELGYRLAPLYGGDGTAEKAAAAIAKSIVSVNQPLQTKIDILSPTVEAFDDWGYVSTVSGSRAIPNSHLRSRHAQRAKLGSKSGLNLHDANLLKIKVTHGVHLRVPLVGPAIAKALRIVDPANAHYYALNQLPITSVATVRMQSEAWETKAVVSTSATPGTSSQQNTNQVIANTQSTGSIIPCADVYGLTSHDALMSKVQFDAGYGGVNGVCGVNNINGAAGINTIPKPPSNTSPQVTPSVVGGSGQNGNCA